MNKELVRTFFDAVINEGRLELASHVLAPDFVDRSPQAEGAGTGGFRRRIAVLRDCFDMRIEIEEIMEESTANGDLVAFAWRMTGRHVGEFAGIAPTEREVVLTGLNLERIVDDRIVEHWSEYDRMALYEQVSRAGG